MSIPLVSIVVPVYNTEEYLDECLDSIFHQTYKNLQIILIDDGSTDNSPAICDKWAIKSNQIVTIHQKNQGPSVARNNGIRHSSGEYLMFVDSDDILDKTAIEQLINIAIKDNPDLVCFNFAVNSTNSKLTKETVLPAKFPLEKEGTGLECLQNIYSRKLANYSYIYLYKRKTIVKNGIKFPEDIQVLEDAVFLNRLLPHIGSVRYCDTELYTYFVRSNDSLGQKTNLEKAKGGYKAILEIGTVAKAHGLFEQFRPLGIDLLIYIYNLAGPQKNHETLVFLKTIRETITYLNNKSTFLCLSWKRKAQLFLLRFHLYDLLVHHLIRF